MSLVGLLLALDGCAPADLPGATDPLTDLQTAVDAASATLPASDVALPHRTVWPIRDDIPRDLPETQAPATMVDVVVIGGGPAGLAAAWDAVDAGASVLVIEQKLALGGSLRYGVSQLLFSGTSTEEAFGVDDSPERLLSEWESFTGGDPTDPWVVAFAERNVEDVFEWLADRGVTFGRSLAGDESGGPTRRLHRLSVSGIEFAEALASSLSDDQVMLSTEARALVRDADGRYSGVVVAEADTETLSWISARAVIVATGGFLRNLDLVAWAEPDLDTSMVSFASGSHADGNGHLMLEAAGAVWQNPSAVGYYAHGVPDPEDVGEELSFSPIRKTIYVNQSGQRFTDEVQYNSFLTGLDVVGQAGQFAWAVADAKVYTELVFTDPLTLEGEVSDVPDEDALMAGGVVVTADSLDELAEEMGVDADNLALEVEAYNTAIADGSVDPWRGTAVDTPALATAPYYAMRVVPSLAKAFGGIDVDLSGRVVDAEGAPIPGLYAAGELTGMAGGSLVGDAGFTGSLSAVILSGRVAGAAAAAEALAVPE